VEEAKVLLFLPGRSRSARSVMDVFVSISAAPVIVCSDAGRLFVAAKRYAALTDFLLLVLMLKFKLETLDAHRC
jgi:hypothetical protein